MNPAHRWIGQRVEEVFTCRQGRISGFGCSPHVGKSIVACSYGGERCTVVDWEPSMHGAGGNEYADAANLVPV